MGGANLRWVCPAEPQLCAPDPPHVATHTLLAPATRPTLQAADPTALERFASWPSIRALHCLAGGAWCAALAAQLLTAAAAGAAAAHGGPAAPAKSGVQTVQARQRRASAALWAAHRACGRLLLASAGSVALGYLLMEAGHVQVISDHSPLVAWTYWRPIMAYFVATAAATAAAGRRAAVAGRAARAAPSVVAAAGSRGGAAPTAAAQAAHAEWRRSKRAHTGAARRHAAARLTFGLARLLVVVVGGALHAAGVVSMRNSRARTTVFWACSYAAAALCIGGTEVSLLRARRRA